MLLLRISLVKTSEGQECRPTPTNQFQVFEHVSLGVVHDLDCDNQNMGEAVEARQVLGWIIAGVIKAGSVEKRQQRSFWSWKLVLSRKARARLKPFANLRFIGARQEFDNRGLAALSLPKQPDYWHWRPLTQLLPGLLKPFIGRVRVQKILDFFEHSGFLVFPPNPIQAPARKGLPGPNFSLVIVGRF